MVVEKNERKIVKLDETSSTNFELKLLQQKIPLAEGSVVMAEFQTAGRGQAGNSWYASKGKNLLFSFLLYPHSVKARKQFIISQVVSLALKKVLDRYTNGVTIKWPNDIYWNDKKIAGILIENSLMGKQIDYTIVGVGLNVNEDQFLDQLPNPISLKQITEVETDRESLLTSFQNELEMLYQSMEKGEIEPIEDQYMHSLYRKDGVHWFTDEQGHFKATIKTVLPSGHLVLATYPDKEERTYAFKEVVFVVEDGQY